jgi:hypothetical protein
MNYRDERDALRGRIDGLEEDLQDARRLQQDDAAKRARVEQIEARMRETEDNLRAMRAELGALGVASAPKKKSTPLFIVLGASFLLAAIGAVLGAFLLVGVPQPVSVQAQSVPRTPAVEPTAIPAPIPEVPTDEPLKPPAAARQVKAQWVGKATRIQGLAGGPGAPCIIDATLESGGDKPRVAKLSVKCSDKIVYDSSDKLEGMSMNGYGMAEEPGKEAATFAYAVSYNDTGARSGPRTQVSIDTTHGQGVAWSEVVPVFRVEFSVPTLSAPVKGEALIPAKKNRDFE